MGPYPKAAPLEAVRRHVNIYRLYDNAARAMDSAADGDNRREHAVAEITERAVSAG